MAPRRLRVDARRSAVAWQSTADGRGCLSPVFGACRSISVASARSRDCPTRLAQRRSARSASTGDPGPPDPPSRRPTITMSARARPRAMTRSVGANRPEAVGAVDRSIHPRPERDLRLVPTRRAHDREVLPVGPLDAALVAARTTDVPHVIAALSRCSTARAAARAALGIRGECLLRVVLLIGRRVDEIDSTVDAGDRPISVGHGCSSGARGRVVHRVEGDPIGSQESGRSGAGSRAPATQVPMWSPCCGRTGSFVRRRIQRVQESDIASDIAARGVGWRA